MTKVGGWLRRFRLFRSRRHKRYAPRDGSYVVTGLGNSCIQRNPIRDISEGGLAFRYEGPPEVDDEVGRLSLMAGSDILVANLAYETVWVGELGEATAENSEKYKGIRFKWLGPMERNRLRQFIKTGAPT